VPSSTTTALTVVATEGVTPSGGAGFQSSGGQFNYANTNTAGAPQGSLVCNAAGFFTAPVPATAQGVKMVPPSGNAVTITAKGITGDTGLPLHPNAPFTWWFTAPGTQATVGFTVGAAVTLTLIWL
jgi:hypothetical protein